MTRTAEENMFGEQMTNSMYMAVHARNLENAVRLIFDYLGNRSGRSEPPTKPWRVEKTESAKIARAFADKKTDATKRSFIAGPYGDGEYAQQAKQDNLSLTDRGKMAEIFLKVAMDPTEDERLRVSALKTVVNTFMGDFKGLKDGVRSDQKYAVSKGEGVSLHTLAKLAEVERASPSFDIATQGLKDIIAQPSLPPEIAKQASYYSTHLVPRA